jgi:Protein of unknown function, DUF599
MGFIHHTTGATGATGLMVGSVRPRGSVLCEHPYLLATELLCLLISATLIGGYQQLYLRLHHAPDSTFLTINNHARAAWIEHLMTTDGKQIVGVQTLHNRTLAATLETLPARYPPDRSAAAGEPQPGQEAAELISSARFHVVKGQDH